MTLRYCCVLLLAVLVAACAPARQTRDLPPPGEYPTTGPDGEPMAMPRSYREAVASGVYPRHVTEVSGPAVLSLLNQAHEAIESARPDQAVALLERALRIEPRNPFLWQALAGTHLRQHMSEQAESVALKSNSLALGNPYIEIENWQLIVLAREARGDLEGAQRAEEKLAELQDRLHW